MDKISMVQLYSSLKGGLQPGEAILDVREVEEFREGHLPGSVNFPLSTLETKLEEIRRFSKVYVHCQAGGRAQKAAAFLVSKGLTNLVCVADGGFGNWKSAGYPIEK